MNSVTENSAIVLIGFGQVGGAFAERFEQHGISVCAYDRNLEGVDGLARLKARTRALAVKFVPLQEAIGSAQHVLSIVPPGQALDAARAAKPYLRRDHVFIDATSVSPQLKRRVAEIVNSGGATFVEAVILDSIGTNGADARILLCGETASKVCAFLRLCGLLAEDFGDEIGRASRLKMLRSVWSKGLEALLLEALVAAREANLEQELWKTLEEFSRLNFLTAVQNWIVTHPTAAKRRYQEMDYVVEALKEIGGDASFATAVLSFFGRSAELDLGTEFESRATPSEVIRLLADRLRNLKLR